MKQFEYLTHAPDFIREVWKNAQGKYIEYGGLQELGRQGWELAAARQGGKWIFKREAAEGPETAQGKPARPLLADYNRGR